jgi:hypothetical protein
MPIDEESDDRVCPLCGGAMKLDRIIPKLGGLPTLRTYQCLDCKEVETVESNA